MILSSLYSNLNLLNIPRELYKTRDSNSAFNASSLFFGSSFRNSYKNSIDTYKSDQISAFAKFFAGSLDSINSFTRNVSNDPAKLNFDYSDYSDDDFLSDDLYSSNSYFDISKDSKSIVSDFKSFVSDINTFLNETEDYSNNSMRILNMQIRNDLSSSKDELSKFAISINEDNRLELNEDKLLLELENRDELEEIASKSDSIFNVLEDRTKKALNESISKYIPYANDRLQASNLNMYNYLSNSQKFLLNNMYNSGSIIDYIF